MIRLRRWRRVYPRVCGGTNALLFGTWTDEGLSPRVRGNPVVPGLAAGPVGSIPACAGEPTTSSGFSSGRRVYPRVCGGTGRMVIGDHLAKGLSPRVRGNPYSSAVGTRPSGSIPACAGEPVFVGGRHAAERVYPRVCGGTCGEAPISNAKAGLSPRVRGNLKPAIRASGYCGSIPACAGEPNRGCVRWPLWRVYPRVCGGTTKVFRVLDEIRGLSPRVRGNRQGARRTLAARGSIPACAGEPRS